MSVMLTEKAAGEVKKIIVDQNSKPQRYFASGSRVEAVADFSIRSVLTPRGIPRVIPVLSNMALPWSSTRKVICFSMVQRSTFMKESISVVSRSTIQTPKRAAVVAVRFRPELRPRKFNPCGRAGGCWQGLHRRHR